MTSTPVTSLLKRTGNASDRPSGNIIVNGELAMSFGAADPGVYFEDSAGSIRKIGPTAYGTVAPNAVPVGLAGNSLGELWTDSNTTTYYLKEDGSWVTTGAGIFYPISSGDDLIDWHNVSVTSKPTPINGIINIFLNETTLTTTTETLYKDLSFNVSYIIAGSGKVIGHTHTDSQSQQIKNNIDKEILLDDTPRTSIKGALYLESYTNLLRDLTVRWQYPIASYDYSRLGEGTTKEALFTTYKMRSKYEGKYLYINQDDVMLNNLAVFVDDQNANLFRYAPGKMTIDYKNGHADLSLWEIIDSEDFEPGGAGITIDFLAFANSKLYEFNYLYEKY